MVDHQVDNDVDPHRVRFFDKIAHVIEGPELRIDIIVVLDIVLVVAGARCDRHEPYSVVSQVLDVRQLLSDPVEISYAVVVRVKE